MNGQKWVKLWVDFLDNEKILSIFSSGFCTETEQKTDSKLSENCKIPDRKRDTILMIWVQILCLAGKINAGGVLRVTDAIPYTPKLLADRLRRKVADVKLALEVFNNLGMIEVIDGCYTVKNWYRYQGSEVEERKREYNRQRYYENKQNDEKTDDKICQSTTTEKRQNLSLQKEKREEEYIKENTLSYERVQKKRKNSVASPLSPRASETEEARSVAPSLEEVEDECAACGYTVDPARFVKYFNDRKWQGVTDWRARLKAWDENAIDDGSKRKKKSQNKSHMQSSFDTDGYFEDALIRSYGEDYAEAIKQTDENRKN